MIRTEIAAYQASEGFAWPGLGAWNLYFMAKFLLFWLGLIDFKILPNILFAGVLLLPIYGRWLPIVRQLIAIPVAIALLYHDSWFPPFGRLLEQPGVLDFSTDYWLELAGRFVNWNMLGGLLVMVVGYLLVSPWLRLTTLCIAGLLGIAITGMIPTMSSTSVITASQKSAAKIEAGSQVDTATLDRWLERFFHSEAQRKTEFPATDTAPFDLLFINICSLAWDDLDQVGLRDNALLKQMDVVFDNFNSATSYSGPAAIRLLRASCGQGSHASLYQAAPDHCLLFENLSRLGFSSASLLNHNGKFDGFLQEVSDQRMPSPTIDNGSFRRWLVGFDGSSISRDLDVLRDWWGQRQQQEGGPVSLFYNSITLHDGNRIVLPNGDTASADYKTRAQALLSDLTLFIEDLERSGRPVVLVIVPEHGAALHGDVMQITGMREIPSASITHVPVGLKLIGMGAHSGSPLHVGGASSYLAISELVSRLLENPESHDLNSLIKNLPETAMVSETEGAQVIEYEGVPYIRVKGQEQWMPYPRRIR